MEEGKLKVIQPAVTTVEGSIVNWIWTLSRPEWPYLVLGLLGNLILTRT